MKNSWSIIRWFWEIAKTVRLQTILNAAIGILSVALDFSFIWATKLCIDIATARDDRSLQWASILLIAIMVGQIGIGFARRWIGALLGVRAQNRMQLRIFRRLLANEWNGRETLHSGDVLNRLVRDVYDVTSVVTETLPSALSVATRFIGAFFFLYSMDAQLALLVVVIVPVFVFISRFYVLKMRRITRDVRDTESAVQSIMQESLQHRIILKTLERTGTMTEKLDATQQHLRAQVRHRTVFSSLSGLLLNMGFATGYLLTFLWGVTRLHEGSITYGMMLAFIQLVGQIQGPFRDMTKFVPVIISAFTAGERLMELEEAPTEIEGTPIKFPHGAGIRLTDVTFRYDDHERNILSHFSFDFPPGSSTAILGETGAGKTTLIRLILALLKPTEGRVEMYEAENPGVEVESAAHDINDAEKTSIVQPNPQSSILNSQSSILNPPQSPILNPPQSPILNPQSPILNSQSSILNPPQSPILNPQSVSPLTRCNLVYVPQGNTLFSGTIRDNLHLGNPDATDEQMTEALHTACADFVFQLPDGLNTHLGENCAGLSQGQAQRISISRALLRDGNILLLDEATSALDTTTEARLLQNLTQWKRPWQTLLFVTHRQAVIEHCTQVLHLDKLPS